MFKKMAVVDYRACRPEQCEHGVCRAAQACPRKVLKQESPYESPDALATMCVGCGLCAAACLVKAVHVATM
jgi:translation initiation factor RLI1